jgi:hypothetical protein
MEEITDELFQKYKHFYECLINDCLVANGIAHDTVKDINGFDKMNTDIQNDIRNSIDYYREQCKNDDTSSAESVSESSESEDLPLALSESSESEDLPLPLALSEFSESDREDGESDVSIVTKKQPRAMDPSYKFYVMKATKNVDGEETIDYPEFRILTGNYVYTQFQPYWMDGNEHINQPWDEIVFEEWYQPPNSETTSTTSSTQRMKYNRLRDELYTNTSGDQWTNHPMGKHYDQLAYYLSDFEGTFMPDV